VSSKELVISMSWFYAPDNIDDVHFLKNLLTLWVQLAGPEGDIVYVKTSKLQVVEFVHVWQTVFL